MTKLTPELQNLKRLNLRELLENEYQIRFNSNDLAICPFHDDHDPSLSVYLGKDGFWKWKCLGCNKHGDYFDFKALKEARPLEDILKSCGNTRGDSGTQNDAAAEAVYIYRDQVGEPVGKKIKYKNGAYSQSRYEDGEWRSGLNGKRLPLYDLPELISSQEVMLLEGEKDCETVKRLGFVATTMGSITHWQSSFAPLFAAKDVYICFDVGNEGVARNAANDIATSARSVKFLTLPGLTKREQDVTDWFEMMGDVSNEEKVRRLRDIMTTSPVYGLTSSALSTKPVIKALTFSEFLTKGYPPRDIYMECWAERENLTILGGFHKVGKSILAVNLGLCIACGINFLGFRNRGQKKVLYIQQEISVPAMKERLNKMRVNIDEFSADRFMIENTAGTTLKLTRQSDMDKLEEFIKNSSPDLVILDPLSTFHDRDENQASEMAVVLDSIAFLMRKYGIGVFAIHHFGKPTLVERNGSQRLRGSSLIGDRADGIVMLEPLDSKGAGRNESGPGLGRISFTLRNDESPNPVAVLLDAQTLWYGRIDSDKHQDRKLTPERIQDIVRTEGGALRRTILEGQLKSEASRGTIIGAIGEAIALGLVIPEILPERGAPMLLKVPGC